MPLHALFSEAPAQFADDFTFRVRTGMVANGRPMALENIRFTTGDPEVAEAISGNFGGSPQEWETKTEETLEILSDYSNVDIIIELVIIRHPYTILVWLRGHITNSLCADAALYIHDSVCEL